MRIPSLTIYHEEQNQLDDQGTPPATSEFDDRGGDQGGITHCI